MTHRDFESEDLQPLDREQLTHQHVLLQATNDIAAILLQSGIDDFEKKLLHCMGIMAHAFNTDRMYIWKNRIQNDELYCTQLYEWSKNVELQQYSKYTLDVSYSENIPGWEEKLSNRQCINGIVSKMTLAEQKLFTPQRIISILVTPVFLKDHFWGFVGIDDCRRERVFSENEEIILHSTALLFTNALLRNRMTEEIHASAVHW